MCRHPGGIPVSDTVRSVVQYRGDSDCRDRRLSRYLIRLVYTGAISARVRHWSYDVIDESQLFVVMLG